MEQNPKEDDILVGKESQGGEEEEEEEGEEMEEEERVEEEQIEGEQIEEEQIEEQIEQLEGEQIEEPIEEQIGEGQLEGEQIEEQIEEGEERREEKEEEEKEWEEEGEKEEEEEGEKEEDTIIELQGVDSLHRAIANLEFTSDISLGMENRELMESMRSDQSRPSLLLDLGSQSEMFASDQFPAEEEHTGSLGPEYSQMFSAGQFPLEPEWGATEEMSAQEQRVSEPKKSITVAELEQGQPQRPPYFPSQKQEKELAARARLSEDSLVSSSTEDTLFLKEDATSVYPLTLTWSYGWNSSLPVLYIRDERRVLLYVCGHTAVLFHVFSNVQHHLQGHSNIISCLCVSEDRRWIATADKGPGCLIIIWDSFSGIPVHTIFDSCPEGNGIRTIAITRDAKYLATISDAEIQQVCVWRWTLAVEKPACTLELPREYGFQTHLVFNPTNNRELVSNSRTQTIYYLWLEHKNILVHSAPLLTEKTFNKLVGKFSQSVFHLNSMQILSATLEGKLVVWDIQRPHLPASGLPYLKPCKLVHLQKEGVTVLTTVDSYIVTGDIKGTIKFYDDSLSIINWYSNLKLSSIRSLSFAKKPPKPPTDTSNLPSDCTLRGDIFVVRNFIIATCDASVYHLTVEGTKLEKLFVEPKEAIYAIACHPYQPLLAIGSTCGMIKMWDYEKKKYLFSRVFEKGLGIQSLTYNPEGTLLGAGFTEGTVYILDAMSLKNETEEPFHYSHSSVTHVSFSHNSRYMATADVSFTVVVFVMVVQNGQRVWQYLARLRSHRKSIQSLLFGVHLDSNEPRLLSLGRDRFLIEYNLSRSFKDHLEVLDIHRTDQGTYPTCMVWYPPLTKELFLLMCNSGYKVKLFNATTKMCRKTLLGPAYGSPIEYTQVLPVKDTLDLLKRYLVFINKDKVGLQILPIDGNPHKTCAIICHPSGVAGLALSHDGRYAFTAGGQDHSVTQWKINLSALDAAVSLGGNDLTPFYGLVSGGREGKFYRELEDYFYYSQLRSQGIDTMESRRPSEHIDLSELPFVMRAIGFYPSEEEIDDMFNEIKFSEYVETGKLIDKINLPDFFKVYLNHRPPFGNTMSSIQQSFDVLGYTNSLGEKAIRREDFLRLLLTKGEHMTEEEMSDCFATLYGLNPEGWKSEPTASSLTGSQICYEDELPDEITAEIFTTDILGLTISDNGRQRDQ
ncbi:cilia- and flagella-associated protein 251-like isoform X1 [Dipodomys merriami]|uniref:cilia- and flagella-associated protein 251-like isoform X1 n=1 Tax=Dipodomys merriami TaxID=94247 RepID=UPI0038558555